MTAGDPDFPLLGRVVRPADYVRVLATPMRLRSPHFAVHHVDGRPLPLKKPMSRQASAPSGGSSDVGESADRPAERASVEVHAPVTASLSTELSTGEAGVTVRDVDDLRDALGDQAEGMASTAHGPQRWLGLVVPKRHSKRAVTRTLVKRQIRNVAAACAARLEPGLWVVRQRSPFDPKQFPSAASEALKVAAREELRALFERAVRGERDKLKPRGPYDAGAARGKPGKGKGKLDKPAMPAPGAKLADPAVDPTPASPDSPPCAT